MLKEARAALKKLKNSKSKLLPAVFYSANCNARHYLLHPLWCMHPVERRLTATTKMVSY